jgi:hypothetical protein
MIGLARGHMEDSNTPVTGSPFPNLAVPPGHQLRTQPAEQNGKKIQSELSRIFEGYVGLNGFQYGDEQVSQADLTTPDSAGGMFTPDGTVFPHLREMF